MESTAQIQTDDDKYKFSFTKEFKNYSKKKRLLTILFLTLMPIYIVSKGFQMRKWKKLGSENPPSAKKYYFIMILIYLTPWAIAINLFYWYFFFILWFITIPVTIYVLVHDFSKEDIKHGTKSKEFKIIGFKKLSFTFSLLLIATIVLTFGGLLLLTITSMIFILFPRIYKKLYFIPKGFLFLSYSFFSFLNIIPGIYVSGVWFIEKDSEIKLMKNPYHIVKHIISNFEPFFILNVGISALVIRIIIWILYRDHIPPELIQNGIISPAVLRNWGFLAIFLIVPLIMAIYFVWVWVWDDAELKVAKIKISTGSEGEEHIKETTLLIPVSNSIKRLFTYLFGVSSIIWVVDISSNPTITNHIPAGIAGIISLMVIAFFFTGVSTIFMGIMYYRSGVHEFLVNKLRSEIKQMYLDGNSTIKVCNSGIQEVEPNKLMSFI